MKGTATGRTEVGEKVEWLPEKWNKISEKCFQADVVARVDDSQERITARYDLQKEMAY